MTAQLKLVRLEDLGSDESNVSLLSYTDGFELAHDGWQVNVGSEDDDLVTEVLTLRGKAANHNTLATKLQSLIDKSMVQTRRFFNTDAEKYSVWLRAQLTNETNVRQALITGMTIGKLPLYSRPANINSKLPTVVLALDRNPCWEDTTSITITESGINSVGGTTAGSSYGTVYGDVPARIAKTLLQGINNMVEFWIGFRSDRYGTPANFQSTWSLRKGTNYADTTVGTGGGNTDATAKDGYKAYVSTWSTPGLVERVRIKVGDVTSNFIDQRGNFTVLLRAKVTGTAVCRVRLGDGVDGGINFRFRGRVPISSTSWKLYPMGTVQIPTPGRNFNTSSYVRAAAMRIDAELVSGSGNLDLDCLILIPNDEGFIYSNNSGASPDEITIFHHPDGKAVSASQLSSIQLDSGHPQIVGGAPTGSSFVIVVAGQGESSSSLAATLAITMTCRQRWLSLRGSE